MVIFISISFLVSSGAVLILELEKDNVFDEFMALGFTEVYSSTSDYTYMRDKSILFPQGKVKFHYSNIYCTYARYFVCAVSYILYIVLFVFFHVVIFARFIYLI